MGWVCGNSVRKSYESDPSLYFKSTRTFLKTGLNRVAYHLLQTKQNNSVFYSSSGEIVEKKTLARTVSLNNFKRRHKALSFSAPKMIEKAESAEMKLLEGPKSAKLQEGPKSQPMFYSITPELSVCKAAIAKTDFGGYLLKKRKEDDKLKSLSAWQKRYFSFRESDKTLSWYINITDKAPRGVIDLNDQFKVTLIEVPFPLFFHSLFLSFSILFSSFLSLRSLFSFRILFPSSSPCHVFLPSFLLSYYPASPSSYYFIFTKE